MGDDTYGNAHDGSKQVQRVGISTSGQGPRGSISSTLSPTYERAIQRWKVFEETGIRQGREGAASKRTTMRIYLRCDRAKY